MRDRQTCIGCGKKSPETETNYTLISAQFGWRLTRYRNADGTIVIEWRCPACWREYKKSRESSPALDSSKEPTTTPRMPVAPKSSPPRSPSSSPTPTPRVATRSSPPAGKAGRR